MAVAGGKSIEVHGSGSPAGCDVTCVGLSFSGGSAAGQSVCTANACDPGVPYVGLSTFGCSGNADSWEGDCCNVATCAPPSPPSSGSCDVTCVGLSFSGGSAVGQSVCSAHACGSDANYVGLSTFGCSADAESWGGDCCDVATCAPGAPNP